MTCYRHPDREVGRRCTRCGKPACSECLVQAAVGSHCVDCAKAARPDVRTRAKYWQARQPAMVTMAIIAVNLLVFVYVTLRDPSSLSGRSVTIGQAQLGLFEQALQPGGVRFLLRDGTVYTTGGSEWYRLVTAGFVHFGIIHLGFNMYLLYSLGNMLEPSIGRVITAAESRGTGLGRTLMVEGLLRTAQAWPGRGIRISAQAHLQRFYGSLGFVTVGEPYGEDNIPHVQMFLAPNPGEDA